MLFTNFTAGEFGGYPDESIVNTIMEDESMEE